MKMLTICFILLFANTLLAATPPEIGVAWYGYSRLGVQRYELFREALRACGPNIKVELEKEIPTREQFSQVINRFEQEKDAMVTFRSFAVVYFTEHPPTIPTFVHGNHPGILGAIENVESPEANITGASFFVSVLSQMEIFKEVIPEMQSIYLLLQKGHPSSDVDDRETRKVCTTMGFHCQVKRFASMEDVLEAVKKNREKVDVFVQGNQALLNNNTEKIVSAAGQRPVFAYQGKSVKNGALGGYNASMEKVVTMLAESVCEVLIKGKSIGDVPVKFDNNPTFHINTTTADRLKIHVPYHILQMAKIFK